MRKMKTGVVKEKYEALVDNDYRNTQAWRFLVQQVAELVVEAMEHPRAPDWDELLVEFCDDVEDRIGKF